METVCWARVIVAVFALFSFGCCLEKSMGPLKRVVVSECGF